MLLRLARSHQKGMIKSGFMLCLAGMLGTTAEEIIQLVFSQELVQMVDVSKCLQEGNEMVNIQHFLQHFYQKQDGDLPLEHMDWDVLLLKRLRELSCLDTEVGCHAQTDSHHRP